MNSRDYTTLFSGVAPDLKVKTEVSFASLTSFHTGAHAALALYPGSSEALSLALELLQKESIPFLLLGRGTNVLAPDADYEGAVVVTSEQGGLSIDGTVISAEAGVSLNALARAALDASLSGLEDLYGIPGTLGGALCMNAGAFEHSIADILLSSDAFSLKDNARRTLPLSSHAFGYRQSIYQTKPLVALSGKLSLTRGDKTEIESCMESRLAKRKASQPLEYPSAGSVFKRPEGHFAGKLIEDAGLKGKRIGGAAVSEKHAGFIVNVGNATSTDVKDLIALVQKTVMERFGVFLEREVRYLCDEQDG